MARKAHPPIHPGEVLLEEFLEPMELSQYRLAKDISVPARRINEIVHGKRGVTADTALRLARYFDMSERFWMNLQMRYDLEVEREGCAEGLSKKLPFTARRVDSDSCFTRPGIVSRQSFADSCTVFRREGLTTYNALARLRDVTERPPVRTFPFDFRPWFSKAVSKISPRLGSTPGNRRGLQGTRFVAEGNEFSGR